MQENAGSHQHQYIYSFILSYNIHKRAETSVLIPAAKLLSSGFLCSSFYLYKYGPSQRCAIYVIYCQVCYFSLLFSSYLVLFFECIKHSPGSKSNLANVLFGGSSPFLFPALCSHSPPITNHCHQFLVYSPIPPPPKLRICIYLFGIYCCIIMLCSLKQQTFFTSQFLCIRNPRRDFLGGAVVKNPPANAGNTGSSPGPGRSHMPRSN